MALDFSKLTSVVKSVADLAASHASLSALAADAKAYALEVEAKAKAELDSLVAAVEAKAQSELDSLAAAIEAALGHPAPLTHAEAAGLTAVATALAVDAPSAAGAPPVSPIEPAAVEATPVPPVAVGVGVPSIADTIAAVLAATRAN
jgi:hypothetical protein